MEYISKSDLIAEIKRMKKEVASYDGSNSYIDHERCSTLDEIQSFIDSMKVEEVKYIDKLNVLNFIRQETCCGLAEADNALSKLINALKERPRLIFDKPYELTIKWNQNMSNFIHCPECKSNFHFADSDIIEDVLVVCPTCKNKICLLQ